LDEVTTPEFTLDRRAALFVFPTAPEPVLAAPPPRQVQPMDETTDVPVTGELRATFLLFALVLLIPTLLGLALLGMR